MLNTFDQVVADYNEITPLRGPKKDWDVRPIGKRSKWWERIIKLDENTYVLNDGYYAVSYGRDKSYGDSTEVLLKTAPIIWMRREDGDYIKIRQATGYSTGRYRFLWNYLPNNLRHEYSTGGAHCVRDKSNNATYLLPKMHIIWGQGTIKEYTDAYLEFKVVDGNYVLAHEPPKKKVPIVNRELTKHYNPKIRELWEYAKVVLPVFGDTLNEQHNEKRKELGYQIWQCHEISVDSVRAWLDEPEKYASERLAVCVVGAFAIEAVEWVYETHERGYRAVEGSRFSADKKSGGKFRTFMQKLGGMYTTKEVDFE